MTSTATTGSLAGLDNEQKSNAALIVRIGKQLGASARDITVAIMTAMDESSLHNLSGGADDSAGLFQQRPSQGWGTLSQVTDPTYAATTFFHRLLKIGGRNTLTPQMEAQSVQKSGTADGSNYAPFWATNTNGFTTSASGIAAADLGLSPTKLADMIALGAGTAAGSGASTVSAGVTSGVLPDLSKDVVQPVIKFVIKLTFALAGAGMVLLGVSRAAKASSS